MTREEAINELSVEYLGDSEKIREAKRMAIKALENEPRFLVHSDGKIEQIIEPCDDAVSRQAVIDLYDRYHPTLANHVYEFGEELKALPSVTPKREQGEWIGHREHCENLGVVPSGLGAYEWCSNCDCGIDVREWHRNHYNYCPNCGAEMR